MDLNVNLTSLMNKYKDNEYVTTRLNNYIENLLPVFLEKAEQLNMEREKRKLELSNESEEYIDKFLQKKYYFCQYNEVFLLYNKKDFTIISEDDIQYQILHGISCCDKVLTPWKHKIVRTIIKKIKDRSPLSAIPDSETIQNIINLFYPKIFTRKNQVKYFLTIIGDNILNKNENLTYITSPLLKNIIKELTDLTNMYFGKCNLLHNIKFKYYEHDFKNTRLFLLNVHKDIDGAFIKKNIISLLCVAVHYSKRFENADSFLSQCTDKVLVNNAKYLTNRSVDKIIDLFIKKSIQTCEKSTINNKNMLFIWKQFLSDTHLPGIIFHEDFIEKIKMKLKYDVEQKMFLNITSVRIPVVASFLDFWKKNIEEDAEEPEIEIGEIACFFKKWSENNFNGVEECYLLDLIKHFYNEVNIKDDKYLIHIKYKNWDRRQIIYDCTDLYKHTMNTNNKYCSSLTDAYTYYLSYEKDKLAISKHYFETIFKELYKDYIDDDDIIKQSFFII